MLIEVSSVCSCLGSDSVDGLISLVCVCAALIFDRSRLCDLLACHCKIALDVRSETRTCEGCNC